MVGGAAIITLNITKRGDINKRVFVSVNVRGSPSRSEHIANYNCSMQQAENFVIILVGIVGLIYCLWQQMYWPIFALVIFAITIWLIDRFK